MANLTKITLQGVEYNLTDKEAQTLIAQLRESTYNKSEVDSLISVIDNKIDGIDVSNYETIEGAESKYQPKGEYYNKETINSLLDGYATKGMVDDCVTELANQNNAIQGLSEDKADKSDTYTKEEVDELLTEVDVTEQLGEYAKKSELPSVDGLISKADADEAYQPKGDYLTEHQSLENYVTKDELPAAYDDTDIKDRVSALEAIDHSQYLTEHQNISNLATKAEVKEVSDKVDAIEVPTKVSELTNDSKYQTEAQVNATIQKVVGAAPEALDTLEEIADKLADNDDVVAGLVTTIAGKADATALNNYYTKSEVESKVSEGVDTIDLTPYETVEGAAGKYQAKGDYLTESSTTISVMKNNISGKADAINVYSKADTYNKTEINEMVTTVNTSLNSKLPIDSFNEWSETVATKEEVSGKVDKVTGKGLSTNDFTNADKAKLDATPTFWVGTQAEYDAIADKDSKTFYYIVEG